MNYSERNLYLIFLAAGGFLLWNYPLMTSAMNNGEIWKKMLYFFGSWIVIVFLTRKLTNSKTSE
ncbi:MAG: hypothetical protein ACK4EX_07745 [Thermaurantimonas sp.]|uniref:hypothetical protein n=1 Tax=Thermaurantimonas sp. TaxID=2681568 RepID=UPI00391D26A5